MTIFRCAACDEALTVPADLLPVVPARHRFDGELVDGRRRAAAGGGRRAAATMPCGTYAVDPEPHGTPFVPADDQDEFPPAYPGGPCISNEDGGGGRVGRPSKHLRSASGRRTRPDLAPGTRRAARVLRIPRRGTAQPGLPLRGRGRPRDLGVPRTLRTPPAPPSRSPVVRCGVGRTVGNCRSSTSPGVVADGSVACRVRLGGFPERGFGDPPASGAAGHVPSGQVSRTRSCCGLEPARRTSAA